jgi:hypothetical protein
MTTYGNEEGKVQSNSGYLKISWCSGISLAQGLDEKPCITRGPRHPENLASSTSNISESRQVKIRLQESGSNAQVPNSKLAGMRILYHERQHSLCVARVFVAWQDTVTLATPEFKMCST